MSRVGKNPIPIPEGVELTISPDHVVKAKGPKGELSLKIDKDISLKIVDGEGIIERPTEQIRHKSLHGLYRALINNMVVGVSEGYVKRLEVVGVGYRISSQGQTLELSLGYSHPIMFAIPPEVKVAAETEKGKLPTIILESNDKQLIGQVAAKIRSFRKPEPYKGKGIRYENEVVRRKAGKVVAAT